MKRGTLLMIVLVALMLSGCSSTNSRDEISIVPGTSKTLSATGYSRFDDSGRLKVNDRWLSAQQFAKLNAYRGLADQLYYEPLGENKTVGSQVIKHESYRVYLDIYLREARASDYRTVKDSLKTELELKLTPRFYQCMSGDVAQVKQCIQEGDKVAFTRLGYKIAPTINANLACQVRDCSDQFYVAGFSKDRNAVDDVLLDYGFYDMEWTINTGARTLFNYLVINGIVYGL